MTPTKAQIDAAAKALAELTDCTVPNCKQCAEYAEAALTAAAQVGNTPRVTTETASLAAAMESNERMKEAATIERCAQVAARVTTARGFSASQTAIVDAIRALTTEEK